MTITTLSSQELNQDVTKAKKATKLGPVIITDHGKPAHVLLSIEDYLRLTGQQRNIVDVLAMPNADDIEWKVEPVTMAIRQVDWS
ncbi:MAG: type II toxin-antitoxin system Phd/YefM family antitoxin [Desulfovibrionales bacterium]|nr:type II toxin-antitoxin system Phd/YefM family antitoxin [Desulfovibrionales bacterium]